MALFPGRIAAGSRAADWPRAPAARGQSAEWPTVYSAAAGLPALRDWIWVTESRIGRVWTLMLSSIAMITL